MQDSHHIEQLFRTHYERMFLVARLLLQDDEEARDVVGDVFVQLLEAPSSQRREAAFLLTAVRNRCLNIIRHRHVEERMRLLLPLAADDQALNSDITAEEREQQLRAIEAFISERLTPQTRRIVSLRYGEQRPYNDIGRELGISRAAVYKHLRQAIDKLRKHFNPDNYEQD